MDLNRLTRDADDLIRKVVSRYNQLYIPSGTISQVELDLMLDDMRKLYDTFNTIGHINLSLQNETSRPQVSVNQSVHPEKQGNASAIPLYSEEDLQNQEEPAASANAFSTPKFTPELAEELEQAEEPAILLPTETAAAQLLALEEEPDFTLELEFEPEAAKPEPKWGDDSFVEDQKPIDAAQEQTFTPNTPEPSPSTLAEKFSTGSKSLSETISPSQPGMGSRIFFHPITDLSSGIGFNDRFRFINELFDNDATQYEDAIARINRAVNHDEASWILQKYHTGDWAQKEETLARLKDFIKRRFV